MEYISSYISPIGKMILSGDGEVLTGLSFQGDKHFLQPSEQKEVNLPIFEQTKHWLDCYFGGEKLDFTLPIRLEDTPFRLMVWEILREIPYGETVTYKYIADRIAKQKGIKVMSAQAVGGAVGHNPISIIVPCHRVIGSDGSLTGYAAGIGRKIELLRLEGIDTSEMSLPRSSNAL